MFFDARTNNFPTPHAGRYLELELARQVQAAFDTPPCLISGLKEAGRLLQYYYQVRWQASMAVIHARQRQLIAMSLWIMRLYIKAAKYNYPIEIKADMRANNEWRERVLAELGGERALLRWEARLSDAVWTFGAAQIQKTEAAINSRLVSKFESAPDIYLGIPYRLEDIPVRNSHRARTDSKGHFRLAPLPRPARANSVNAGCSWQRHPLECWSTTTPPVPVYPHELRAAPPEPARGYHLYLYDLNLARQSEPPSLKPQRGELTRGLGKPNSASYLLRPT